ncbi:MAG TPA: hypothetical protein VG944_12760 [Fimbriimonas sp.]|nr:hypothetical protein [Fimbriimonas sp.]
MRAAAAFFLAAALVLTGCGGGGGGSHSGGSGGGGGFQQGAQSLKVSVSLPAGYHAPSGGLFLSGGLFDKSTLTGTSGTIKAWGVSRELVGLIDSNGNPVLMGWVAPGHATLDANSTAAALLYFQTAGFAAPEEDQEVLIEGLEQSQDLSQSASDINAELLSSGNLSAKSGAFRSDIAALANRQLGPGGPGSNLSHHSIAIDPSLTTKSGIQVAYGTVTNQVVATNTFRRRALLFLDEVSTTDTAGRTVPAPNSIGNVEIDPATGSTTASLNLLGSLGGFPAQTSVVVGTLPDPTGTIAAVSYKVTAAGAGLNQGETSTLTATEQKTLTDFLKVSFVKDFCLPLLNHSLVTNALKTLTLSERQSVYASLQAAVDANGSQAATFVDTTFPNAVADMESGDYRAAQNDVLNALSNPTKLNQLATFYDAILVGAAIPGDDGSLPRVQVMLKWLANALGGFNLLGNNGYPEFQSYDTSDRIDSWQVVANQNKVSLKANPGTVQNDVPANLTSVVDCTVTGSNNLPPGSSLLYTWSTTGAHGDLTVNNTQGTLFKDTTSTFAVFGAYTGLTASAGTDTVTVQVSLQDAQHHVTPYGSASLDVRVQSKNSINLRPVLLSVKPNNTTQAILETPFSTANLVSASQTLQWHCANRYGKLNAPSGPTTLTSVTYTAGPNLGVETVTCDLIENGKVQSGATMTIKVETQPTIVFGSMVFRPWQYVSSPGVTTFGNGVLYAIPKTPGAKSYAVHCYGFYDPLVYHDHYDFSIGPNGEGSDPDLDGADNPIANATYWMKWGPGGASSNNPGFQSEVVQSVQSRLGGMIIEVTVSY